MGEKRCLMIGAGGFAGAWVHGFLPAFEGRLRVVGLVDIDREVLDRAGDALALGSQARFTDAATAFAAIHPDFCVTAIPPRFNKETVSLAVEHGVPVLSEKPIAECWQSCVDILHMVTDAGLKMAVTQNYRYDRPMLTMKRALQEGAAGRLMVLTSRFAVDHRHNGGGRFRYDIPDIMLYEASVHHFDQLRNLSGSECDWITGKAWNPPGSGVDTECCGLFVLGMANGVTCQYETAYVAAGAQNDWHHEYYRASCERGDLVVDRDGAVRLVEHIAFGRTRVTELEQVDPEFEGHLAIIDQFLNWLDGGAAPPTQISDNIKTDAICFAAAQASRSGEVVHLEPMLRSAGVAGNPTTATPG